MESAAVTHRRYMGTLRRDDRISISTWATIFNNQFVLYKRIGVTFMHQHVYLRYIFFHPDSSPSVH